MLSKEAFHSVPVLSLTDLGMEFSFYFFPTSKEVDKNQTTLLILIITIDPVLFKYHNFLFIQLPHTPYVHILIHHR